MRPRKINHNQQTIDLFKQNKVLTFIEICSLLQLSRATVRRRLKEWEVISSYNKSGQYYTLPLVPKFNKQGLWNHEGAFFSKHGTMKNTVILFKTWYDEEHCHSSRADIQKRFVQL